MVEYNKRTIWGNIYCHNQLVEFRSSVIDYFNSCEFDEWDNKVRESDKARSLRVIINQNLLNIQDIIQGASVAAYITYTPPPIVGGYRQNIDLIANIFHLHQYEIEPKYLVDVVDRTIGVYRNDRSSSFFRTFNPFFWFGLLLDYIVSAPFKLLGKAGVNAAAIEKSILGKIFKLILYIVSLIAGVVSIAQPFGWLDKLKQILGF